METLAQIPPSLPLDQSPATTKRGRGRPRLQKPGLSPTPKLQPRRNPRNQPPAPITSREFHEGDLVWARVKTQPPWWPGRVGGQRNEVGSAIVFLFGSADAVAWCEPQQLKPFREEFDPMVRQSVEAPFVDAVKAAMDVSAEGKFGDFLPREFLGRVREIAVDVFSCGLLEAALLRSWVYGFVREYGVKVVTLADLVDVNVAEPLFESMVGKGPEITDVMSPTKKKRSLAELTAVPDMGKEEVAEASRKQKQKEAGRTALPSVEIGAGVSEEDMGSPRGRDRKKSKYLSPPYTFGSGYTRSNSFKDMEVELPKDGIVAGAEAETNTALVGAAQISAGATEKVEVQMIPSFNYASTSADVMLSHLLHAAINPLKPNSSAVAMRSFFEESRKLYSRNVGFENYLKELVASGNFNRKTMNDIVDKLEEETSAGKSVVIEVGASEQAALSTGNARRKRGRPRKVHAIGGNPMNLGHPIENELQVNTGLSTSKRKENGANGGAGVNLGSEQNKARQERMERKSLANGGAALLDFGHNVTDLSTKGQKRKSSKEASNGGIQSPTLVGTISNHSDGRASRQVKRKKEGTIATPLSEPKAPLPYLRENLEKMILALAGSSGVVLSQDLKPETKEYLIFEIHGLLNKVKNLQTGNYGTST